ncbi:tyrosine-type recombinase/integrase [Ferruginibacter sp.]|nr:site-specific integrase [Ferruginibacter sp.]
MRKNIQQLFEEFMYECEFARKVKPKTLLAYSNTFQLFIRIIPDCSLDNLTQETIVRFFKVLQERKRIVGRGSIKVGIKKSTVATYWIKLNAFFEWLTVRKHITSNPFSTMRFPSPEYVDKKFLKKEDIEKIITGIHSLHNNNILALKRNLVIFYILLFCGLRREELLSLQVRDIDFARKTLTVRGETSKSGRSRDIPLHSTVLMHLKDYFDSRRTYTTPYLIVSTLQDEKLTDFGLKHLIDKLKLQTGVEFHVHQLRHTFAVNFLKTSNNILKLKQLMGHKDISITMIYLRCLPVSEFRGDIENMNIDSLI